MAFWLVWGVQSSQPCIFKGGEADLILGNQERSGSEQSVHSASYPKMQ